jgi:hypothetical protein
MYNSIEFTAQNLSAAIFYRPYWFLYADVDDAKSYLDGKNIFLLLNLKEKTLIYLYC